MTRGSAATLNGITRTFGPTKALDDVSVAIDVGEVLALLGENGAGKTTLVRVLSGLLRPDSGTIEIGGEPIVLTSRLDGVRHGIGFVHQHLSLVPELTALQNMLLGHPDTSFVLDTDKAVGLFRETSSSLGIELDPFERVNDMPVGRRQQTEIVIALSAGARILVLDEPTSLLGASDVGRLLATVDLLRRRGVAVVYISHKLEEVLATADHVVVLRKGRHVAAYSKGQFDRDAIVTSMVGSMSDRAPMARDHSSGPIVSRLKGVSVPRRGRVQPIQNIDLAIRSGEIVGVAGVIGSGQATLARVLAGVERHLTGEVETSGGAIAYVPEDRHNEALALNLSVTINAAVREYRRPPLSKAGLMSSKGLAEFARDLANRFKVVVPSLDTPAWMLSGGNQQRLVVGREIRRQVDLVVANNPYLGLDVASTHFVRDQLVEAAASGAGVVLISPDLDELREVSDRIVVMFDGAIVGEVDPRATDSTEVGRLMAGSR